MRFSGLLVLALVRDCFGAGSAGESNGYGKTFVHLFEWSWEDIARECEVFLGPKGYAAVQISPPNEHVNRSSWMARYQPVTYQLVSRSGSPDQLKDMVQRCRAVGVSIYADVVINHMAPQGGVGVAGSQYTERTYPPNYGPEDMHHSPGEPLSNCGVGSQDDRRSIQYCDVLGMPDLCTGCSHVQAVVLKYIADLESVGIDGIRIDAAHHQNATELDQVLSRIDPRLFKFLEISRGSDAPVRPEEYLSLGQVAEPLYGRAVAAKFAEPGAFSADLSSFGEGGRFLPGREAIVFLDSHNYGAAPFSHRDAAVHTMAMAFMLAWPYGYPRVMSSYSSRNDADESPPHTPVHGPDAALHCGSGEPWVCQHRIIAIANMVAWRRVAGDANVTRFLTPDSNTMMFCRGTVACIAFNRNEVEPWEALLELSLPPGPYCDISQSDDSRSCPFIIVSRRGSGRSVARATVPPLGIVALHVGSLHRLSAAYRWDDQGSLFVFCCCVCVTLMFIAYGLSECICTLYKLGLTSTAASGPLLGA